MQISLRSYPLSLTLGGAEPHWVFGGLVVQQQQETVTQEGPHRLTSGQAHTPIRVPAIPSQLELGGLESSRASHIPNCVNASDSPMPVRHTGTSLPVAGCIARVTGTHASASALSIQLEVLLNSRFNRLSIA